MSGSSNPVQQPLGHYFFSIHPEIMRMSAELYGQPLRLNKHEKVKSLSLKLLMAHIHNEGLPVIKFQLLPIYRLPARVKKDAGKNEIR